MYNISDLNAMSDNELKTIAENMGLKKINPAQKDELIYRILDQQAIDHAASATEKKATAGKQSRAKKDKTASPAAQQESASPAPRRGRPPKTRVQDTQPVEQPATPEQPETGTPDSDAKEIKPAAKPTGRRNRDTKPTSTEPDNISEPQQPQQPQQPQPGTVEVPVIEQEDTPHPGDELTLTAPLRPNEEAIAVSEPPVAQSPADPQQPAPQPHRDPRPGKDSF